MNSLVYLAGTIEDHEVFFNWRRLACNYLLDYHILTVDPTRDYAYHHKEISSPYTFVVRDELDIKRCDLILAGFPIEMERQSVGTFMELGMARALDIPFVVWSKMKEVRDHPFIQQWAVGIFDDLNSALSHVVHILE